MFIVEGAFVETEFKLESPTSPTQVATKVLVPVSVKYIEKLLDDAEDTSVVPYTTLPPCSVSVIVQVFVVTEVEETPSITVGVTVK